MSYFVALGVVPTLPTCISYYPHTAHTYTHIRTRTHIHVHFTEQEKPQRAAGV